MTVNRRSMLIAGLGFGAAGVSVAANSAPANALDDGRKPSSGPAVGLQPNALHDQSSVLQAAIDKAADAEVPLVLPPGKFRASDLRLRSGTRLIGAVGTTILEFAGGPAFITADRAADLLIDGIVFDGAFKELDETRGEGLLSFSRCAGMRLQNIEIRSSSRTGSGSSTGRRIVRRKRWPRTRAMPRVWAPRPSAADAVGASMARSPVPEGCRGANR